MSDQPVLSMAQGLRRAAASQVHKQQEEAEARRTREEQEEKDRIAGLKKQAEQIVADFHRETLAMVVKSPEMRKRVAYVFKQSEADYEYDDDCEGGGTYERLDFRKNTLPAFVNECLKDEGFTTTLQKSNPHPHQEDLYVEIIAAW